MVNELAYAVKEAKFGEQLAAETFFLTRLDTLLRAGTTYWSWVGAKQKAVVSAQILDLAHLVVDISRQQEKNGDLARIYVTEAEEDEQRRDADLSQAQREFQRSSFRLSTLLLTWVACRSRCRQRTMCPIRCLAQKPFPTSTWSTTFFSLSQETRVKSDRRAEKGCSTADQIGKKPAPTSP